MHLRYAERAGQSAVWNAVADMFEPQGRRVAASCGELPLPATDVSLTLMSVIASGLTL